MVEDTPHDLVHDIAAEAVFGAHPLGRPVIGRAEVISSVSPPRAAPRITIARTPASSSCSRPPATCARARSSSCSRSVGTAARASVARAGAASPCAACRRPACASSARTPSSTTSCLSAPGIARTDERRFAASVLDAILGGSASSRLFQEIREKRGMAYSVYSYASQYADTGQIGLYVGTREDNLAGCLEIAVAELADVAAGNVRPRASSSARRRTSRAGCCSRSSRRPTA